MMKEKLIRMAEGAAGAVNTISSVGLGLFAIGSFKKIRLRTNGHQLTNLMNDILDKIEDEGFESLTEEDKKIYDLYKLRVDYENIIEERNCKKLEEEIQNKFDELNEKINK